MNTLRIVALLAAGLAAALVSRGADRTGPAPTEMIFPRAADGAANPAAAPANDTDAFAPAALPAASGMLPAVGYLIAFGALIGGVWFLLKRGTFGGKFARSEGKLRVLETRMLGNRQFLMVVEYEDAKLLLGVCPGKIDYLTPLAGHPLATGASGVMAGDDESAAVPFTVSPAEGRP